MLGLGYGARTPERVENGWWCRGGEEGNRRTTRWEQRRTRSMSLMNVIFCIEVMRIACLTFQPVLERLSACSCPLRCTCLLRICARNLPPKELRTPCRCCKAIHVLEAVAQTTSPSHQGPRHHAEDFTHDVLPDSNRSSPRVIIREPTARSNFPSACAAAAPLLHHELLIETVRGCPARPEDRPHDGAAGDDAVTITRQFAQGQWPTAVGSSFRSPSVPAARLFSAALGDDSGAGARSRLPKCGVFKNARCPAACANRGAAQAADRFLPGAHPIRCPPGLRPRPRTVGAITLLGFP